MIDSPAPKKHHLFRVPSKIRTKETISFFARSTNWKSSGRAKTADTQDIQTNSHTDRQTDNKQMDIKTQYKQTDNQSDGQTNIFFVGVIV